MELELTTKLPAIAKTPGTARELIRALQSAIPNDVLERVELLVTELITNSYRHAGLPQSAEITMHVFATRDHVRVEISDPGRGFRLRPRSDKSPQGSGWGLYLVERLTSRWGIRHDDCTCVWFEIDGMSGKMSDNDQTFADAHTRA